MARRPGQWLRPSISPVPCAIKAGARGRAISRTARLTRESSGRATLVWRRQSARLFRRLWPECVNIARGGCAEAPAENCGSGSGESIFLDVATIREMLYCIMQTVKIQAQ